MNSYYLHALLALGLSVSAQAQLARIVVEGSGGPQVFTDITTALAAAQANDKIYLSGGTFSASTAIILSIPLHFIGAGTSPDSSAVTSTTTLSTTAGGIVLTTGASGSTFTGIRFAPDGYFQYGTNDTDDDPTGLVFDRCTFDVRVITNNSGSSGSSSTTFNECVFHSFLYGQTGVAADLMRCVLDHQAGTGAEVSGFHGGGLTMRHCIGLGTRIGNSTTSTIENCIFTRTSAPVWQSGGSILTNNLCVSAGLTSNMTPGATVGNVLGVPQPDIFVNETNDNFEWSDDVHLQATSAGIGMATDGTDVGIYGTSSPFKPGSVPSNPHFQAGTIALATDGNGALPVNIRTEAQTH